MVRAQVFQAAVAFRADSPLAVMGKGGGRPHIAAAEMVQQRKRRDMRGFARGAGLAHVDMMAAAGRANAQAVEKQFVQVVGRGEIFEVLQHLPGNARLRKLPHDRVGHAPNGTRTGRKMFPRKGLHTRRRRGRP